MDEYRKLAWMLLPLFAVPVLIKPVMAFGTSLAELHRRRTACSSAQSAAGCIEGRLLLCNIHQTAANLGQCLALSDASATVCCLVPCFHCGLLDKMVRVTAWNYVTGCYLGHNRGLLEVLSLDPVGSSLPGYAEQTFPSLCVDAVTANARDHVLESPLATMGNQKTLRLTIQGLVVCISPPFSLPQGKRAEEGTAKEKNQAAQEFCQSKQLDVLKQSRLGFLVELTTCEHLPAPRGRHHEQGTSSTDTGSSKVSHVYFSQSVSCWQPALLSKFGQCIAITGLRRKCLRVEGGNLFLYVATRTTLVLPAVNEGAHWIRQFEPSCQSQGRTGLKHDSLSMYDDETKFCHMGSGASGPSFKLAEVPPASVEVPCCSWNGKGKGTEPKNRGCDSHGTTRDLDTVDVTTRELTSYQGIVTDIFEQNLVVEMDRSVFILLTHAKNLYIATLRTGMTLRACDVHKVVIQNHWTSSVVLGACSRSHIVVEKFPALRIPFFIHQPCQNALGKFLEHLTFALAFWIFHVKASFSLKFAGIISQEELVGTKKHSGLIQKYFCTRFTGIPTVKRNAVNEFLDHEHYCTFDDVLPPNCGLLVPPISNFLSHICLLWNDTSSVLWHMTMASTNLTSDVGTQGGSLRRTISGSELGVILLGCLQVSRASGKLQMVDGTGAIDVVVPDFHSVFSLYKVYEVSQYVLVLEGPRSGESCEPGLGGQEALPLSSSNILKKKVYGKPRTDSLRIFLYFHLKEATHLEQLQWPVRSPKPKDSLEILKQILLNDRHLNFNVLMVTHKHPLVVKAASVEGQAERPTFLAEAISLSCSLAGLDRKQGERLPSQTSILASSEFPTAAKHNRGFKDLSREHLQSCEASLCFPTYSHQQGVGCESFNVRFDMPDIRTMQKVLPTERVGDMHLTQVLLEFCAETVELYALLRIGEYYLLQLAHPQRPQATGMKLCVGVGVKLWSLHIASEDRQDPTPVPQQVDDTHNAGRSQTVPADSGTNSVMQFESASSWMEVDVVVRLSAEGLDAFQMLINLQRTRIVPPVFSRGGAFSQLCGSLSVKPLESEPCKPRFAASQCMFEAVHFSGDLVSITGRVRKVGVQQCCKALFSSDRSMATASHGRQCADIEVGNLKNSQRVKILFTYLPDTFPLGLGQGATVTFHRIAPYPNAADSAPCYMSKLATFVVVHTAPFVPLSWVGGGITGRTTPNREGGIIQFLTTLKRDGPNYALRGRLVRVRRVILRWQGDACPGIDIGETTMSSSHISISAHFTLDVGTRNIACWAAGQVAGNLLGLAGAGGQLQARGASIEQRGNFIAPGGSISAEIARMVKKHQQIFVHNNSWDGCEGDAGAFALTVDGVGRSPVSAHEESLLKSLVLQACQNRQWDLLCEVRVSKRKTMQVNGDSQRHYLSVVCVKPVEFITYLKNICDQVSNFLLVS